MAIAFARINIHTRSQGHSAVAGAAYRAGQTLYDERTGETHSYDDRDDVKHSEILLPEGATDRFKDHETLWNEVERCEKRKDSQLAKDVILALAKEADLKQQVAIAKAFANEHFVSKGLVADLAIHDHGDGNPHAHLYITLRRLEGDRFSKYKARDLNPSFANGKSGQGFVSEQDAFGEKWRDFQSDYFKEHGLDITVDENLLFSQRHTGRLNNGEASYLKAENDLKKAAARDVIMNDPDYLLGTITARHAVFTEKQLASIVFKATDCMEEYQLAFTKLKGHKDILPLGEKKGLMHYTTRQFFEKEAKMAKQSDTLSKRVLHKASREQVNHIAQDKGLTDEQTIALRQMTLTKDLNVLVGRAGTGKSYMLGAANAVWQDAGYDVMGISVSGIATKGLAESSNIPSYTMTSFKQKLKYDLVQLDEKSILVVDEAGMMDLHDMLMLVERTKRAGAKLVLVGDPNQLQPIGPGAPFRVLAERHGFSELADIYRQKDKGDKDASRALAKGQVERALTHYKDKGALKFEDTPGSAMKALIAEWSPNKDTIILAHQNKHVDKLNLLAREDLIKKGGLGKESIKVVVTRELSSPDGVSRTKETREIDITQGERIMFRKKDKSLDVVNGDFGNITKIEGEKLHCQFDDGRKATFNTKQFNEFDYGYAATVHKSQGITKENAFVFIDGKGWDKHLAYVALTRHKDSVKLYTNKETFKTTKDLSKTLSRGTPSDSTLDWAVSFSKRHGFNNLKITERVKERLAQFKSITLHAMKQRSQAIEIRGLDR